MVSVLEYMQFSTRVYEASASNKIGVPAGWEELDWQPDQPLSGFSAGVYKNKATNEIVIAYTGTNDTLDRWLNWDGVAGIPGPQIFEAMAYYLGFKAAFPDADITFTGHSLGGALA